MKTLNKGNRVNLAIIAVVLTLIVWALIKYEFMTYEEIKYAAGVVATLLGFFYQMFGKLEVEKENIEIKKDFEKKVGVSHDEFKMIKNR